MPLIELVKITLLLIPVPAPYGLVVELTLLEPVAGVIELVSRARQAGWYVTIASRARRQRLLRTLEMLALPVDFDLIMGTEDLVDSQTDCKVHTRTVTPFGVAPRHCVVVEDSASGVREACACNVGAVIGLTTSLDAQTLQAAGAAPVLETLFDVTTFLAPLMADGA